MDGFDLYYVWKRLRDNYVIVVLIFILSLVVSVFYLKKAHSVYDVDATLLIKGNDKNSAYSGSANDGALLLNGLLLNGTTDVNNEMQVLKSSELLRQVVDSLNLNISYEGRKWENISLGPSSIPIYVEPVSDWSTHFYNEQIPQVINVNGKDDIEWINGKKRTKLNLVNNKEILYNGIRILRNSGIPFSDDFTPYKIIVEPDKKSAAELAKNLEIVLADNDASVIHINLHSSDKTIGTKILDLLLDLYIKNNHKINNEISDSTIAFINTRLDSVQKELGFLQQKIVAFRIRNNVTDLSMQSKNYLDDASEYRTKNTDKTVQLRIYQNLETLLENRTEKERKLLPTDLSINNSNIEGLISKYNDLITERRQLLLSTTETNAYVRNLERQLDGLTESILTSVRKAIDNVSIAVRSYNADKNDVDDYLNRVPGYEKEYGDLLHHQELLKDMLDFLIKKREDAFVSKMSNLGNVRILSKAWAPDKPVTPQKSFVFLIAIFLAGGMSLLYVIIHDRILPMAWYAERVKKITQFQYIGRQFNLHNHSIADEYLLRNLILTYFNAHKQVEPACICYDYSKNDLPKFEFFLRVIKQMQRLTNDKYLIINLSSARSRELDNIASVDMPNDSSNTMSLLNDFFSKNRDNSICLLQPNLISADKNIFLTGTAFQNMLENTNHYFSNTIVFDHLDSTDSIRTIPNKLSGLHLHMFELDRIRISDLYILAEKFEGASKANQYFINVKK